MKPRVLIAMHYMELGGAEMALTGLLRAWDYGRADVDLFIYSHRGELMEFIPDEVNLLPEKRAYASIEGPVKDVLRRGFPYSLGVLLGRWLGKRSFFKYFHACHPVNCDGIICHIGQSVCHFLPRMSNRTYDLAISFLVPHHYVLHKVNARRKVCWIHTDYSYSPVDVKLECPMWSAFDNIVSISPAVTESFCTLYPELRPKIVEAENILPVDLIRYRAKCGEAPELSPDCFNILSIGRFSDPKNFESVPRKLRRTIDITGRTDLRWHLIGYGLLEDKIRKAIVREGMEGKVNIIGKRANPYPYITACQLYAQPSLFEGKSISVREAQALGRPVVITDYATARSQVNHGVDGLILPMDDEKFAAGLAKTISSPHLLTLRQTTVPTQISR